MAKYKLNIDGDGVHYPDGGNLHIPESMDNRDWREYQEWLAIEGNTPDPAETDEEKKVRLLGQLRSQRQARLIDTDFYGNSDVIMSEDMLTYRQTLRDMPTSHTTISKLESPTWPTKPADE